MGQEGEKEEEEEGTKRTNLVMWQRKMFYESRREKEIKVVRSFYKYGRRLKRSGQLIRKTGQEL